MAPVTSFADVFWGGDFCSTQGFETICRRMKEGRSSTKDFEDFLKQRLKIEQEYSKALVKLGKSSSASNELGSMREAWDCLRSETEKIGLAHVELALCLQEQTERLNKFSEQQKAERKRIEEKVKHHQDLKKSHYNKVLHNKKDYESKCRDADKAKETYNAIKLKGEATQKDLEKLETRMTKSRQAATSQDQQYKISVESLEKVRKDWEKEMANGAKALQQIEEERMRFTRQELWFHTNIISQACVEVDRECENVRNSLEKTSIQQDIELFIRDRQTGTEKPRPIVYESYYSHGDGSRTINTLSNRPPALVPQGADKGRTMPHRQNSSSGNAVYHLASNTPIDDTYATVGEIHNTGTTTKSGINYKIVHHYAAKDTSQISVFVDNIIYDVKPVDDKWLEGRTEGGRRGLFPKWAISDSPISLL
ncbi:unnamed protein product [Owenia fusiformis]|uniref:F-BAR domain-containing protein n=1 Tax=Owenia fusiformis TaxID=6347 RepID=A0A8J1UGQ0_OWEFU|nr:unnamed protein product [Owenia fusiformis]CAH1788187.1 unnamed protein product [Owenia fusiformis]